MVARGERRVRRVRRVRARDRWIGEDQHPDNDFQFRDVSILQGRGDSGRNRGRGGKSWVLNALLHLRCATDTKPLSDRGLIPARPHCARRRARPQPFSHQLPAPHSHLSAPASISIGLVRLPHSTAELGRPIDSSQGLRCLRCTPASPHPHTTMPPHLHPRSRSTMSLFTTTLAVSFLVVATPHFLPCPVDPRALADSSDPDALSGQSKRRRRRIPKDETCNDVMSEERRKMKETEEWATPKRECPVPKPGGLIGQVLGLKKTEDEEEQTSVTVQVQRARRKTASADGEES